MSNPAPEAGALAAFMRRYKTTEAADVDFLLKQLRISLGNRTAREAVESFRRQMLQVGHNEGWAARR